MPQGVKASLRKGHKCKCDCETPTKTKSKSKSENECDNEIVEYHFIADIDSCHSNGGNSSVGSDQSEIAMGMNY